MLFCFLMPHLFATFQVDLQSAMVDVVNWLPISLSIHIYYICLYAHFLKSYAFPWLLKRRLTHFYHAEVCVRLACNLKTRNYSWAKPTVDFKEQCATSPPRINIHQRKSDAILCNYLLSQSCSSFFYIYGPVKLSLFPRNLNCSSDYMHLLISTYLF